MPESMPRYDYTRLAVCAVWTLVNTLIFLALAYAGVRLGLLRNTYLPFIVMGLIGFASGAAIFGVMNMGSLCSREEEKDERYKS